MMIMFFNKEKEEKIDLEENYITKKEFKKLKRRINSHHNYLNMIQLFYELEPKAFLKELRDLSDEFLKFFDNVCSKYGLKYWMDSKTLLDAVSHDKLAQGYDRLYVGISENDYSRLIEAFKLEIEDNDMKDVSIDEKSRLIAFKPQNFENNLIEINVESYDDSNDIAIKRVRFGKYYFSSPDGPFSYLKRVYGKKYVEVSNDLSDYGRFNQYMDESLEQYIGFFRQLNQEYGVDDV